VEETIRTIAEVHAEHHRGATPFERLTGRTTAWVGRPKALIYLSLAVVFWLAANLGAPMLRLPAFDPPPFNGLSTAASVLALYVTILILTTQRREDVLSQRRQQLMLELAILGEQKSAKTIQLLEEIRWPKPCPSPSIRPPCSRRSRRPTRRRRRWPTGMIEGGVTTEGAGSSGLPPAFAHRRRDKVELRGSGTIATSPAQRGRGGPSAEPGGSRA
jgi:uncharacterized membrane protein